MHVGMYVCVYVYYVYSRRLEIVKTLNYLRLRVFCQLMSL